MEEAIKKAEVLIEALPYIKKFHKKVAVIKYGGSILGDKKIRHGVLEDIVFLSYMGLRPVLVHGGGPNISERMKIEGKKTDFVDGMRVTDSNTLKIVEEELRQLNLEIAAELKKLGSTVAGFGGADSGLITAQKKNAEIDLGFVGTVTAVDAEIIEKETLQGRIPVVSPMGRGKDGNLYNINADEAAAHIAVALKAEKSVVLTNVQGIIRNNSFLSTLTVKEANTLIESKVIQEGMIPKVSACIFSLENGVKKTHIIDARIPHGLLLEIFTDQGIGTEIVI